MIFEELKIDFNKYLDGAWGLSEEISKDKGEAEVQRHVQIWNKVAEFMDYGILVAPNLSKFIPIYFTRKFPSGKTTVYTDEGIFIPEDEFLAPGLAYRIIESHVKSEYIKLYRIHDWSPTLNFNHAKECESKLLKEGKYKTVEREDSKIVKLKYSGPFFQDIFGEGKNELEAICNACINFSEENKNVLKKEYSGVLAFENK